MARIDSPPVSKVGPRHLGVCLLLVVAVWCVTGVAAAGEDITIRISGGGVVERDNDTVYVWQSGRPIVDVRFSGYNGTVESVCLGNEWALGGSRTEACRLPSAAPGDTRGVLFRADEWFTDAPGPHRLTVTLRQGSSTLAVRRLSLVVLRPDGDVDRDGLSNRMEVRRGTNLTDPDTDGDGVTDGAEAQRDTDPTDPADPTDAGFANDSTTIGEADAETGNISVKAPSADWRWFGRRVDGAMLLALGVGLAGLTLVGGLVGRRLRRGGDGGNPKRAAGTTRPPDLSPDQQHAVRLLSAHGGQLRQSEIVEKSGWSKSKVSRLLSDLESVDVIQKDTVGRENVVVLDAGIESGSDDEV